MLAYGGGPRGHSVPCFSDPLLQNWKIAGNVYLSLSIQEITCKETTRPASADTIIPAPSNTSWFRPRREGLFSASEPLRFLPHEAKRGGQDGRQVITGWTGNSAEKKKKKTESQMTDRRDKDQIVWSCLSRSRMRKEKLEKSHKCLFLNYISSFERFRLAGIRFGFSSARYQASESRRFLFFCFFFLTLTQQTTAAVTSCTSHH